MNGFYRRRLVHKEVQGVTGLEQTGFMGFQDLFEGRREKGWWHGLT